MLTACSTKEVEVTREVTREVQVGGGEVEVTREVPAGGALAGESRLQIVKNRGRLVCGSRTDLLGFGYLDQSTGRNIGFDIDLCRAVAAAIFDDPDAVEFVPLTAAERGPALQTAEIDMLSRNVTWTSS